MVSKLHLWKSIKYVLELNWSNWTVPHIFTVLLPFVTKSSHKHGPSHDICIPFCFICFGCTVIANEFSWFKHICGGDLIDTEVKVCVPNNNNYGTSNDFGQWRSVPKHSETRKTQTVSITLEIKARTLSGLTNILLTLNKMFAFIP